MLISGSSSDAGDRKLQDLALLGRNRSTPSFELLLLPCPATRAQAHNTKQTLHYRLTSVTEDDDKDDMESYALT